MSNKIELLHLDAIKRATRDTLYKVQPSIEYSLCYTHAGVTKQIAIEFANWIAENWISNGRKECWDSKELNSKFESKYLMDGTNNLFQEFLKSKEIKLPDLTCKDVSKDGKNIKKEIEISITITNFKDETAESVSDKLIEFIEKNGWVTVGMVKHV